MSDIRELWRAEVRASIDRIKEIAEMEKTTDEERSLAIKLYVICKDYKDKKK
jgi:hypothetical protein